MRGKYCRDYSEQKRSVYTLNQALAESADEAFPAV